MPTVPVPRVAVAPDDAPDWIREAVMDGGAELVAVKDAEALVWGSPNRPDLLESTLARARGVTWIQLPWAGIEQFMFLIDAKHVWTAAKGVYAEPVAELALTLALAGLRGVNHYARAESWQAPRGRNLIGDRVTILGGGGIAESLLRLLGPFRARVTVVRNRVQPMTGADAVLAPEQLHSALSGAHLVVLALSLTPSTEGIIGATELGLMSPDTWLVNVARGRHVVTDDLVDALRHRAIGGAGLDVTDPEPLPPGHPLWSLPNCLITPHVGNTPEMARPLLAARISTNVARFAHGEPLVGLVDPDLGY